MYHHFFPRRIYKVEEVVLFKDMTGEKFYGVEFVKFHHKDGGGRAHWIVKCVCSKHFIVQAYNLTSGHTKSCGCLISCSKEGYAESVRKKIIEGIIISSNGCWEWQRSLNTSGYAQIVAFGKPHLGHRLSYRMFKSEFKNEICVLHKCDNAKCLNPDHLFLGTISDNNLDMLTKGRKYVAKGSKSAKAKLNESQVLEIRKMHESGQYGCYRLSKIYNVGSRAIWSIVNRRTWRHI